MTATPIPGGLRRALWTSAGVLATQMVGSLFNIWYNLTHIRPLLNEAQAAHFEKAIRHFNLTIYPIALLVGVWLMRSLMRAHVSQAALECARRRVVNLPWWVAGILTTTWLLTIPVLLLSLHWGPGTVDPRVYAHLPISVVIAALIAIVQGFFVVEILSQRLWYPVLFQNASPLATPGAVPLTIGRRGILWAVSAVACPIISLLLIIMGPETGESERAGFALSVGGVGILFGFTSAWMLGRIVIRPVEELRRAARRVGEGKFDTQIDMLRADEFGMLIEQFNHMVCGLRQKERSEELLGRNVGPAIAKILLERGDDELAGLDRRLGWLYAHGWL